MHAFLKSDLVWKFVGGFVLGTIGVISLQSANARNAPSPDFTPASVGMIDATL